MYPNDKQKALQIVASAETTGRMTAERAALLRATVYGRTLDSPRYDSAIVIAERLLYARQARDDAALRQNILTDLRLAVAARLLIERPDLSVAEVARASGFARADTLTNNFKQRYTLTPMQYRTRRLKIEN